jgi:hypothetical protein
MNETDPRVVDVDGDARISLSDPMLVGAWAKRLGVSAERLREVVARVGPRAADVAAHVAKSSELD